MTTTQINVQGVSVTRAQFVKVYRDAEKRATVSAGGLAFLLTTQTVFSPLLWS